MYLIYQYNNIKNQYNNIILYKLLQNQYNSRNRLISISKLQTSNRFCRELSCFRNIRSVCIPVNGRCHG